MKIALLLHLLGAIVWIGGMFFAYLALRPAAAQLLDPPLRLSLWHATLRRFFHWVWIAVLLIFGSGLHMLVRAYQIHMLPGHVLLMIIVATVMALIFLYVYVFPFRALGRAVDTKEWAAGAAALATIRRLVGTNLVLGLTTVAVAVVGSLFI